MNSKSKLFEARLLLCTDMDRTIIPNGSQAEDFLARKQFSDFCSLPQVTLVYVTGRHQAMVKDAIRDYNLPMPNYAITDVGTMVYRIDEQEWHESKEWKNEIAMDWNGNDHSRIKDLLADITDLNLQEEDKQNIHKLSYYVALHSDHQNLLSIIEKRLQARNISASLIWSIDEPKAIGLLDVLPKNATKLHAIEFLRRQLNYSLNEVVFAGDSGNDLPVLTSTIPSVLVGNATSEVREMAQNMAKSHLTSLFLATGKNTTMNGNYAAGVLEGVCHFSPVFRQPLIDSGFYCGK